MGVLDAKLVLSDAQAETSVGSHDSDNAPLDMQTANPNWGPGTPVYFNCRVNTAITSASSATFQVKLQHCDTSGGTYVDLHVGPALTAGVDTLTAGTDLASVAIATGVKRYVKAVYVIGVAVLTAGKWDTGLELNPLPNTGV